MHVYLRLVPYFIPIIELLLMVAAAILIVSGRHDSRPARRFAFRSLELAFGRFAHRRLLAVFAVGASVVTLRAALIPVLGIPQPRWHDEFSYLLAADTFAHGRLTNPTHPMWIHFETIHEIERPTYMSIYPPAQGLVLALGQMLSPSSTGQEEFEHAWIGQLLITGCMCSALCWMLQAWVPASWALLGGLLAALWLGLLTYWMNGYWCASLPAFAGALVLGAWPRLRQRPLLRNAVLLALGLIILANTRPYEGLFFSLPIAWDMLRWLLRDRPPITLVATRVIVPIVIVLLLGALATGFYYSRVTGSPWQMTYAVDRAQYGMTPFFLWQKPLPDKTYNHAVLSNYYRRELNDFESERTLRGYLDHLAGGAGLWWRFYLGPLLTLPLLSLPWLIREKKMALPLAICAATSCALAVESWHLPHYFSPATGALYILIVQGLRHLRVWRRHSGSYGRAAVRLIPLLACGIIVLQGALLAAHTRFEAAAPHGIVARGAIVRMLDQLPGPQLVLVSYSAEHDVDEEWVYNDASIDAAKVVWARHMNDVADAELLQYFEGRKVWRLNADDPSPHLDPY